MIYKSYLVEQNINIIKENLVLFYGENLGLKNHFKQLIRTSNKKSEFILFNQEEILKNQNLLFNELNNISLFGDEKIFFIDNTSDKIIDLVKEIREGKDRKVYLFADLLEKKSKIRNYFEKSSNCSIIACYPDNEITIKNIIKTKLKTFEGLTQYNLNLIVDNSNLDRVKLNNEIEKIILYFQNKKIETLQLEILLNTKVNDEFNIIRDEAILGNKNKTNKLLTETEFENEKIIYYISSINQRLQKLNEINYISKKTNLADVLRDFKPPIFWKDRPIIENQVKKWNSRKISNILNETYNLELNCKTNNLANKKVLIKKLIVDICNEANA